MKSLNSWRVGACALVLLAVTAAATVSANPATSGALGGRANRIVGLWSTLGMVRPCGSDLPFGTVTNTLLFHAGGTVVENPHFPPAGAPDVFGIPGINQRGQALGTWSYDPAADRYWLFLRFDWYVDDAYHGYMTIDRELVLSNNGMEISGPVSAIRYTADGTALAQVCGEATSERL